MPQLPSRFFAKVAGLCRIDKVIKLFNLGNSTLIVIKLLSMLGNMTLKKCFSFLALRNA